MSIIFPPKLVGATIFADMDFISRLEAGETITGVGVVCSVFSGVDAAPSAVLVGAPAVIGSIVRQQVTGGLAGVMYLLTCTVTTSLGATKIMNCYLAVLDTNPFEAV